MNRYLSEEEAVATILRLKNSGHEFIYDYHKHKIIIMDKPGNEAIHFRLPITLPPPDDINGMNVRIINYIILLVQSGSSAMGYFEGKEIITHKVFKSYMVRKKQGKSQIKHLKTKGKSKAGSRIRLGNALRFFEDINERLQEYFEMNKIDRIAMSCSKTLIPYLFNAKVECPFEKKDERIFKIPKHTHIPGFDVLLATHKYLQKAEFSYSEGHQEMADLILGDLDED